MPTTACMETTVSSRKVKIAVGFDRAYRLEKRTDREWLEILATAMAEEFKSYLLNRPVPFVRYYNPLTEEHVTELEIEFTRGGVDVEELMIPLEEIPEEERREREVY